MRREFIFAMFLLILLPSCSGLKLKGDLGTVEGSYRPGDTVKAVLFLENLEYTGKEANIVVTYSIESDGVIANERTVTIPLGEQRKKILSLDIPEDLNSGTYDFKVFASYNEKEMDWSDEFDLKSDKKLLEYLGEPLIVFSASFIILALFLSFRYLRNRREL